MPRDNSDQFDVLWQCCERVEQLERSGTFGHFFEPVEEQSDTPLLRQSRYLGENELDERRRAPMNTRLLLRLLEKLRRKRQVQHLLRHVRDTARYALEQFVGPDATHVLPAVERDETRHSIRLKQLRRVGKLCALANAGRTAEEDGRTIC